MRSLLYQSTAPVTASYDKLQVDFDEGGKPEYTKKRMDKEVIRHGNFLASLQTKVKVSSQSESDKDSELTHIIFRHHTEICTTS